jgi:hypothetical protein
MRLHPRPLAPIAVCPYVARQMLCLESLVVECAHLDTGGMAEIQRGTYVRVVRWSAVLGITLAVIGAVLIVLGLASENRGLLWSAAAVILPFSLIPLVFAGLLRWFVSMGATGWSDSAYRKFVRRDGRSVPTPWGSQSGRQRAVG